MTGVNHVLTGTLIVAVAPNPVIGLPLAFVSHFILDALPHFGNHSVAKWGSSEHREIVIVDASLCLAFLLIILLLRPDSWGWLIIGGALAISPDIVWLPYYVDANRHIQPKPYGPIARLHKAIQWGERPWGMTFEGVWFVAMAALFYGLVLR